MISFSTLNTAKVIIVNKVITGLATAQFSDSLLSHTLSFQVA